MTVDYATAGGTAEEGADYAATSGTLTFAPGETARTIAVPTLEDEVDEENETFNLDLSNPGAATLQDGAATGTINDDDEPPVIVVADAEAEEGDPVEFTIALSAFTSRTVTVNYATAGGTAEEGADYTATSGTLTFVPGETAQTIAVLTLEDEIDERNETFTLDLGNPHAATIQDGAATGTINDDDEPVLSIGDAEAREGDAAEFLVTMWPAGDETVTVSFRTVDGTAVAGLDYTSTMGTLRFEPGETSATIAVSTLTDELADDIERFMLELSDPVEATVGTRPGWEPLPTIPRLESKPSTAPSCRRWGGRSPSTRSRAGSTGPSRRRGPGTGREARLEGCRCPTHCWPGDGSRPPTRGARRPANGTRPPTRGARPLARR